MTRRLQTLLKGVLPLVAIALLSLGLMDPDARFSEPFGVLWWLIGPLFLLVLSLFAFKTFRSAENWEYGALAATLGVLLLFLGLESGLRIVASPTLANDVALPDHPDFDQRSRREVVAALRAAGEEAVPFVTPTTLAQFREPHPFITIPTLTHDGVETHPLGGVPDARTVACREDGTWILHATDEKGFYNPPGLISQSRIDVALVGDSYTQGICVPLEDSFAGLIRQAIPQTLNLGMGGNGPLTVLGSIKEYLTQRKPPLVIWFLYENDSPDLVRESRNPTLYGYLNGATRPVLDAIEKGPLQNYFDQFLAAATAVEEIRNGKESSEVRRSYLLQHTSYAVYRDLKSRVLGDQSSRTLFDETLGEMSATVSAWGGRLLIVTLPSRTSLEAGLGFPQSKMLEALFKKHDVTVFDLRPAFLAQRQQLAQLFPRWGTHYNARGHALVAREVLGYLNRSGLQSAGGVSSRVVLRQTPPSRDGASMLTAAAATLPTLR
ncbi:MAG: hypothetical protein HQL50_07045 [Magnetococcales bacterium]|nr:hypothetical protein [Magnetococcales bacterium]